MAHIGYSAKMQTTTLSQLIADRRAQLGHSRAEAARVIGVTRNTTSRWERGYMPFIAQYPALAEYLGISPLELRDLIENVGQALPDVRP